MRFDTVLAGGLVVDPKNGLQAKRDIAIVDGRVVAVQEGVDCGDTRLLHRIDGKIVIPGVIDLHVHTSRRHAGMNAHRMMAKAGVVTALDMGGPLDEYYDFCVSDGAGLNMLALQQVRPGLTVEGEDPSEHELQWLLERSLEEGAIGLKILGGHYPMTSEATRRIIEVCNRARAFVAFHAGTLRYGSNIEGLLEAVELSAGMRNDIPHINSYCCGQVRDAQEEILLALDALKKNRNVFSESYLATINGTSAKCVDGVPESHATRGCLAQAGYEPTEAGLRQAILDGYGRVNQAYGGVNVNVTGADGVRRWESAGTVTSVNFPQNPPISRLLAAVAKDGRGEFVVDALGTDGGAHPRNVQVERGMALVRLEAWTLQEFVRKVSYVPSRILGLVNKGHLSVGADADVTVVEEATGKACMSMALGKLVMLDGAVIGEGTTAITTSCGVDYVKRLGLRPYVVNVDDGVFYSLAPGDLPRPL